LKWLKGYGSGLAEMQRNLRPIRDIMIASLDEIEAMLGCLETEIRDLVIVGNCVGDVGNCVTSDDESLDNGDDCDDLDDLDDDCDDDDGDIG